MSQQTIAPPGPVVNPPTLTELRIQTLLTVASLCATASLPVPRDIAMTEYKTGGRGVRLTFDHNDVAGVCAWADHLGLGEPTNGSTKDGATHWYAARVPRRGGALVWLGWHDVDVVTFLDGSVTA